MQSFDGTHAATVQRVGVGITTGVTCNVTTLRTAREGALYVPRSGGVRAIGCSAVTSPVVDLLVFNEMVGTYLVEGAS
jgi:hypothetical protein